MKEEVSNCGRENDLISFLYGELNEVEAQGFQGHLRDCATCNVELAAFGDVRESVVAWRNESLGTIVSPGNAASRVTSPITNIAAAAGVNKAAVPLAVAVRSTASDQGALSALREFFNLSPLWLKGAVAFASVLFFVFAGLAITRLRDKPPVAGAGPATSAPSDQELNALVQQRVQAELERIGKVNEQQQVKSALAADNSAPKYSVKRSAGHSELAANATNQKARRPLSKTEREQLAADLRLTSGKNDGELDLLDDRINQ